MFRLVKTQMSAAISSERCTMSRALSPGTWRRPRAAVELAKDWRTDRFLRRLEAMMLVADREKTLVLTGTGDVLEPERDVMGIGSGGNYALAAARALLAVPGQGARDIVQRSLEIAADICVYTNRHITVLELPAS